MKSFGKAAFGHVARVFPDGLNVFDGVYCGNVRAATGRRHDDVVQRPLLLNTRTRTTETCKTHVTTSRWSTTPAHTHTHTHNVHVRVILLYYVYDHLIFIQIHSGHNVIQSVKCTTFRHAISNDTYIRRV